MGYTFYHGTSDIFLDSIKCSGLGGVNPNEDYKLLEILRYLFSISEKFLLDDERYLIIRSTTNSMANQSVINYQSSSGVQRLNFEHGHTYVSCQYDRALLYSKNEYGSEILTRIIQLYRLLKTNNHNFSIPNELDIIEIDKISKRVTKSVLITLENIQPHELLTEFGDKSDSIIDKIFKNDGLYSEQWVNQNGNFRLVNQIEKNRLRIHLFQR